MSSTAPEKKRRTMNPTEALKKRRKSTEPLKKKRRKSNPTTEPEKKSPTPDSTSISILSIPDELLLICIARVSRLYYPTLSLVSKRFRSLVASPELYKTRSLSGRTESFLYVAFDCSRGSRWFTLSRNPDDSYALTRVLTTPNTSRSARFPSLVAVGSDIYNIAECESILPSVSSRVSILDCRSHTWRQGPSFPVELLRSFTATVVDRMIYVAGSYRDGDGKIRESVKVLDIDTQTWDHVPIPGCQFFCKEGACIDGKFHLVTDEGLVAYDSKEGRWSTVARKTL